VCYISLAFFDDRSTLRWALLEGFYLTDTKYILRHVVKRGLRIKGLCNGALWKIPKNQLMFELYGKEIDS
jgi:hypothetical protein